MASPEDEPGETSGGFLAHFEISHSVHLDGMNPIADVMNDMRKFRSAVCNLPPTEITTIISGIQECIDNCSMDVDSTSQRLKLLQDISSSSGLFPNSYEVLGITRGKRITYGGEATLYAGCHGDRAVVIRQFHTEGAPENLSKTIIREVISHRQLRHPNIVALIGVYKFEEESFPSVILRRAEHSNAIDYLKLHPEPECFAKILLGLIEGLYYLHTRSPPFIHGDLHDKNVVVTNTGDCLLCDFGLSRIRHELSLTSSGIRQGGNYRFIAPEISSGVDETRINEQSDVYSLAMTIYALGTRDPPFKAIVNPRRASQAAVDGERPPKHDSLGGLTAEHTEVLWSLMEKMWSQDPQLRPTIFDVRDEISQSDIASLVPGLIATSQHPSVTPPSPTNPPDPPDKLQLR